VVEEDAIDDVEDVVGMEDVVDEVEEQ